MAHIAVVAVPFILADLHRRLAEQFLASVVSTHTVDRIAIANSLRGEVDIEWLKKSFDLVEYNDSNILARAWNRGIKVALARGAELVIVANLDIILHPLCLDNLLECSKEHPDALVWSPVPWHDRTTLQYAELRTSTEPRVSWSCFAVTRRLFEVVGEFDEEFTPAYREDSDMAYRMKLSGRSGVSSRAALFFDVGRGTIKGLFDCVPDKIAESAKMLTDLRLHITKNDERYVRKWGMVKGVETFKTPFNR